MPMTFSGVTELAAAFGEVPSEVKAALQPAILEAADIIATEAKAEGSFSSYIPGAISVAASFAASGGGAVVRVAERGFPHAGFVRVFEGNGVSATPFRHPVYGNRNAWAPAMTHPFLHTALEAKRDEATEAIATAVKTVIEAIGL